MSYAAAVNPLIDAVMALITAPDGWTKDGSASAPPKYEPNKIYCWPYRPQEPKPAGMDGGEHAEIWFYLRVAWSFGTDEEEGQVRKRETADALDAAAALVEGLVRANRANDVWEWLELQRSDPTAVVTFQERAAWFDLAGYRLV